MHTVIFLTHPDVDIWNMTPGQVNDLAERCPDSTFVLCRSEEEFVRNLPEAEMVLTWTFRQEWLALAPHLKIISTPAAGKDYFHIVPPESVTMLNGQFHGELMAETAVGGILAMTRGLLPAVTTFSDIPWARRELTSVMRPLRGSTILIIGFGHIGQWCGRLLKPFGVSVIGLRRNLSAPVPDWFDSKDKVIDEQALVGYLPLADHVILALPSGKDTDLFLDKSRLERLPDHATITNIGRGNAVDYRSLADLLRTHRLAGAYLDVFPAEPLPADSGLRNCPNLWMTPHSSAIAPNYLDLYIEDLCRQLGM